MNRVALVTGALGGIGGATLRVFAEAGWIVLAVDRRTGEAPSAARRLYQADVSLEEDVRALFEKVTAEVDRLDALVNNAAIQITKPLVETAAAEWDEVMASNLRSAYLMTRQAYPLLRQAQGAVVNVSTVHAMATSAGLAAYAASKGGLAALTRAMAIEFAPDHIRVNAVLPGAVDTPMLRAGLERGHLIGRTVEERLEELGRRSPLGRIGHVSEIAHAIRFLADADQASFITGQLLVADGGALARLSTE